MSPEIEHVPELVDAYLFEALPPGEMSYVARHCAQCPACQAALDEARQRRALLESLPPVEASEKLIQAALAGVGRRWQRRRVAVRVGWSLAAAAALVLAVLHTYCATLAPSPWDLRLLGQNELLAGSSGSLRVVLVDRRTNRGVEGADVEVTLVPADHRPTLHLARFTTDGHGSARPRFQVPDAPGDYELDVRARWGWGWSDERLRRPVKIKRSWQVMLSSDKPVYQPGQTIRLRALTLARPDLRPVAGQQAVFTISDPRGNLICRRPEATSAFGIASSDCPLADEILEGLYQVRCELNDTSSTLTLEVKKYVLPKFKIDLDLDRAWYEPGQRAAATIRAAYFFGQPLADAEVELQIESAGAMPATTHTQTARTDAHGLIRIEFPVPASLPPRPQAGGDGQFTVSATVRDAAGQQQRRSLSRSVTTQPIRIEVIPEAGSLVPAVENLVYFFTSYPDGTPAETRIAVSGLRRELATNRLGVASVDFVPDARDCKWVLRAVDAAGTVGRREVQLAAERDEGDFLVRTDKAVYDGGQTMHLLALGTGQEPVFVDLIRDGQTMLTETIEVVQGRGELEIDLPAELCGTLQLCAYRYDRRGFPVRKTQTLYVRPARALQVTTTLDRPTYRPGQRARLQLALTDEQGRPAPGALSLAAVDEAVYAVLAQRPGSEQTFFLLEQELLKPVYALYPWSPDLKADAADRNLLEKALFSWAPAAPARDRLLEEIVRRYADGNRRLLEVLDRPDWEDLADRLQLPKDVWDVLREARSSDTLAVASFPQKAQAVDFQQHRLEGWLKTIWIAIAAIAVVMFLVFLLRHATTTLVEILIIITILGMLTAMMFPAVQSARESARRSTVTNQLFQLGVAVESAKSNGMLPAKPGPEAAPARLRQWFPETLLWRPELITDDQGRAELDVDLADSITTWRLAVGAVSKEGQLGGAQEAIRVFQPFFVDLDLPVALLRNDEVEVPAVVYNYTAGPLEVALALQAEDWFESLGEPATTLTLKAGEVRAAHFRIRAVQVGRRQLHVEARSGELRDAVVRPVEVRPDGHAVEEVRSGQLDQPLEIACRVPAEAIAGSLRAPLKLYPSRFSQLVEGLDAIFQRPYGCFEQTSSTTYPNVLALAYLRSTGKSVPAVEAKAREYIHLGYQRLLGFEVAGGGFDWFGRAPANTVLTAYGLMEFDDMARVVDVDPELIRRTRTWLLARQQADGTWLPESRLLHETPGDSGQGRVSYTAYVAWAVFGGQAAGPQSERTLAYLTAQRPAQTDDPYVMALVANALRALAPRDPALCRPWLERLREIRHSSRDGRQSWWACAGGGRTMFYGGGHSREIESTALAVLAMLPDGFDPPLCRQALSWLVAQKEASGLWSSTQASILALKALVAGTGKALGEPGPRQVVITCDGQTIRELTIPADQSDVMQQVDLAEVLTPGTHRLHVEERSSTAMAYQFAWGYHLPGPAAAADDGPLAIEVTYDRTELAAGETLAVTAAVTNRTPAAIPMAIVDLPIPAGFALDAEHFARSAAAAEVAKYQLTPRTLIVYLRQIPAGKTLSIAYRLSARMPGQVTAAPAHVYEYYDPDRQALGAAARLHVRRP